MADKEDVPENIKPKPCTVQVYLDTGVVCEYVVTDPMRGREHAQAIITSGYRTNVRDTDDLEWYPPHRIIKVRVAGGCDSSKYRDTKRAT